MDRFALQPLRPNSTGLMSRQRGVSSILLIALIVLMASLGVFALNFVSTGQALNNTTLMGIRAEQAALAGLEWQRFKLNGAAPSCVNATTLAIALSSGNFPVTVLCTITSVPAAGYTEGPGPSVRTYAYTATACWPSTGACPVAPATPQEPDYVERSISGISSCAGTACN
jgi:MSHA biogenesis protein MshP